MTVYFGTWDILTSFFQWEEIQKKKKCLQTTSKLVYNTSKSKKVFLFINI